MNKTQEFIKKAITVHGDKYDYSKVEYINNRNGVIIICNKHDEIKEVSDDGNRNLLLIETITETELQKLFDEMKERGFECKIMNWFYSRP